MELTFRRHFKVASKETLKDVITKEILADEELLFHWSLVSVNWGELESIELLRMIAEHWITIRGYSSASAFNELYKIENKKTVQKSKALRKALLQKTLLHRLNQKLNNTLS